ncbi:MAG: hypothetical protein RR290_01200 [Clostridia bacterium]
MTKEIKTLASVFVSIPLEYKLSTTLLPAGKPHKNPKIIGIDELLDNLNILDIKFKYFDISYINPDLSTSSVKSIKGNNDGNTE